jgi:Cu/Ag efflux pump CusA
LVFQVRRTCGTNATVASVQARSPKTMGRDIESIVKEAKQKWTSSLTCRQATRSSEAVHGAGYGALKIVVPIRVALIFFLLFSSFNSLRYASLIILNLPFALIGDIFALWISVCPRQSDSSTCSASRC